MILRCRPGRGCSVVEEWDAVPVEEEVVIRRSRGAWVLIVSGIRADVWRERIGTDRLALPWTAETAAEVVRADVRRRFPLAVVSVEVEPMGGAL